MNPIRITIWNEFIHERQNKEVAHLYPQGLHGALAAALRRYPELTVGTATLEEPEHGLTQEVLEQTDVLTWWGHAARPSAPRCPRRAPMMRFMGSHLFHLDLLTRH